MMIMASALQNRVHSVRFIVICRYMYQNYLYSLKLWNIIFPTSKGSNFIARVSRDPRNLKSAVDILWRLHLWRIRPTPARNTCSPCRNTGRRNRLPLQGCRAAGDTRLSECHAAREGIVRGRGGSPAPNRPKPFLSPSQGDISSNALSAMIFPGDLDSI